MLDYRDPATVAAQEPAPPPPPPQEEGWRPIRRTITIGKNNPDRAYENEQAPNAGVAPYDAPSPSPPMTQYYYGGYSGYPPYGASVARSTATSHAGGGMLPGQAGGPGSVTTPPVGGDWPSAPSYGPAPVRSRTQP
jgi:hypothetical protein